MWHQLWQIVFSCMASLDDLVSLSSQAMIKSYKLLLNQANREMLLGILHLMSIQSNQVELVR